MGDLLPFRRTTDLPLECQAGDNLSDTSSHDPALQRQLEFLGLLGRELVAVEAVEMSLEEIRQTIAGLLDENGNPIL